MRFRTSDDLGALLRERRTALGLSQAALGKEVGASRQWVVDLERGKPTLALGLVLRACEALKIDLGASSPPLTRTAKRPKNTPAKRGPTISIDPSTVLAHVRRPAR